MYYLRNRNERWVAQDRTESERYAREEWLSSGCEPESHIRYAGAEAWASYKAPLHPSDPSIIHPLGAAPIGTNTSATTVKGDRTPPWANQCWAIPSLSSMYMMYMFNVPHTVPHAVPALTWATKHSPQGMQGDHQFCNHLGVGASRRVSRVVGMRAN